MSITFNPEAASALSQNSYLRYSCFHLVILEGLKRFCVQNSQQHPFEVHGTSQCCYKQTNHLHTKLYLPSRIPLPKYLQTARSNLMTPPLYKSQILTSTVFFPIELQTAENCMFEKLHFQFWKGFWSILNFFPQPSLFPIKDTLPFTYFGIFQKAIVQRLKHEQPGNIPRSISSPELYHFL